MSTSPSKPGRLHLAYIDGMRAVAALVVVLNHAYAQTWCAFYGEFPPPELAFLTNLLAIGHLAVSVFIVISGYCLYLPLARNDGLLRNGTSSFFRRRARRILPPYYAALVLSLVLIATLIGDQTGSLWDVSAAVRPTDVASHVLLLQNVFGTGRINYVFWSIALEWQLYFLFPVLALGIRRWSPVGTLILALVAGFSLTLSGLPRIGHANYHYIGLFVMGMLAARVAFGPSEKMEWLKRGVPWRALAAGTLGPAAALILLWGWRTAIDRWPLLDLIVGVGAASLLLSAAQSPRGLVSRAFSLRPLAWLGVFSYSLYLIHAPLLQVLWLYALRPLGMSSEAIFVTLLLVGVPLIVGVSYLFFRAFEAPFMNAPPPRYSEVRAAT